MSLDLKKYINEKRRLVEEFIDRAAPKADIMPSMLHSSMRYSLEAGGKRVRPILAIAAAEAVAGRPVLAGGNSSDIPGLLACACSLEFIHTYSLIHDDLPAMDNDDFRRGKPTNHKVYGEAAAILAGDALLTFAFELLSSPTHMDGMDPARRLGVIHELAFASGSMGMVGGQVVDMESEGKEIDFVTLEYIHTRKTGALIRASVRMGAIAADASDEQLRAITRYGEEAGLSFQIADDILDITGTQEEIGKDVGSDMEKGKKTYPAMFGLEESRSRAMELQLSAVEALDIFGISAEPLREIARYIVSRKN
ncbi:MAG: polyprenyl synthetase family protein [Nitrospirota bacterium]